MRKHATLTQLADLHGSDKGSIGPSDHWGGLNYTDVYAAYLEPIRNEKLRVLEIGIGAIGAQWDARIVHGRNKGGASIKMWYDYFPNAAIFAIDINPATYLDNDRISTFIVDQSKQIDLKHFIAGQQPFDVIIDDGSHIASHQQLTLSMLFPHLNNHGCYIIEDLDANGLGDPVKDVRAHDSSVLNTRKLLKNFLASGKIEGPHAFQNTDFIHQMRTIQFHSPEVLVHSRWQLFPPKRLTSVQYQEGTERLCIMQKSN